MRPINGIKSEMSDKKNRFAFSLVLAALVALAPWWSQDEGLRAHSSTASGDCATLSDAPTNLTVSTAGSSVMLNWLPPSSGCVPTAYQIEGGSGPGLSNLANFSTGSSATTLTAGAVASGGYYVRVRASTASGLSAPSNEVQFTVGSTPCSAPPLAPTAVAARVTASTVVLTWNASTGAPGSYVLEAGSAPGLTNIVVSDTGSAATSFTAVAPAGTYYVRVRARNLCGTSGPSNEIVLLVGRPDINTTTSYRYQNSVAPTDIGQLLGSNGFGGYYYDARQYIDLDGDGVQEIVVAAGLDTPGPSGPILVFKRQGNGTYSDATSSYFGSVPALVHPRKAIAADFNGDGLPDLYFADHGYDHPPFPGAQNALLLSDRSSGKWSQKGIAGSLTAFSHCATAGDVDNNGTIDIFACGDTPVTPTESNPVRAHFLLNDGTGNMTVARNIIPINVGGPMGGLLAAELVDVDDDGYLDLVAGYQGASSGRAVIIFWGNGTLPFSATRATQVPDPVPNPPAFPNTYDIKAEDINGDGRRDLVLLRLTQGLSGYYFQVLLQTEARSFVDESLVRIIGAPSAWEGNTGAWFPWIHMADLNGDGFVDLAIDDSSAQLVARSLQWLNDRRGFFSKVP